MLETQGTSVNGLAIASGIPQSTLSRKLNGTGVLNIDEIDTISAALGVSVLDLLRPAA